MARAWDRALFQVSDMYPGADDSTRRSLGMMNRNNPSVTRILEVLKSLGINAQSPYWKSDCWAHIGLVHMQVAIVMRGHLESGFVSRMREKWGAHRYKVFFVSERNIETKDKETIRRELQEALRAVGKVGKR